jgi:hypothetical protein
MSRHKQEWWAKRVTELGRGGDAEQIARRHGVRARTLVWWRSELARRARALPSSGARLLPVVVDTSRARTVDERDAALEVVVEIGPARVCVRGAVTAEHLAAVVEATTKRC